MAKKYKITVKGTGQLNGSRPINQSFITEDAKLAQSFTGANRYQVIEAWIQANYPGVKIPNIRSFSANVVSIKDENDSGSWWQFWK